MWVFPTMARMLSTGGTAGRRLFSVLNPEAPPQPPGLLCLRSGCPCGVSSSQYSGATYSYGPVILTPLSPVTLVFLPVADETTGLGQNKSFSTSRYICSTSGGGALSLPFSHITRLGWLRRR